MFQTLQPHSARIYNSATASPGSRKMMNFSDAISRPHTVGISSNQITLTPLSVKYKTMDLAEVELNHSFRKQMSPFIKDKIRQLNHKNQRRIYISRPLSQNVQNPQFYNTINTSSSFLSSINSPINMKQVKICNILNKEGKHPIRSQTVVDQGLIVNTKQRINRLISLKDQQQERYLNLNRTIKTKCSARNPHLRRRSMVVECKPHITNQCWDQQWKQGVQKEHNRYRNRLLSKHIQENSIKIKIQ